MKRAETARSSKVARARAAKLRGLPVHRAVRGYAAANGLHRTLDRGPKPRNLGGCAAFRIIFADAFAMTERHQQVGTVGDLAAPYRRAELGEGFPGDGHDRALGVVAACRGPVQDDRVGLARSTA